MCRAASSEPAKTSTCLIESRKQASFLAHFLNLEQCVKQSARPSIPTLLINQSNSTHFSGSYLSLHHQPFCFWQDIFVSIFISFSILPTTIIWRVTNLRHSSQSISFSRLLLEQSNQNIFASCKSVVQCLPYTLRPTALIYIFTDQTIASGQQMTRVLSFGQIIDSSKLTNSLTLTLIFQIWQSLQRPNCAANYVIHGTKTRD